MVTSEARDAWYNGIVEEVLSTSGSPQLLYGRPGQGKTTALREITRLIQNRSRALQIFLPFDHICYSPQFFDEHAIRICVNSLSANSEGMADDFANLVYRNKIEELRPFLALEELCYRSEIEIIVLVDEIHDLAIFKSYPGFRQVFSYFVDRFVIKSPLKFIATTSFIRRVRPEFYDLGDELIQEHRVPVLDIPEIARLICEKGLIDYAELAQEIFIITNGNQGYAKSLIDHVATGDAPVDIKRLTEAFLPDGPLELKCRFNYEYLISKSRGEGIIRHLLSVLAELERPNLTAIAKRMQRSLGVTKDYLKWLLAVGFIDVEKKRYSMPDELLKLWIHLYRSGRRAGRTEVLSSITKLLNEGYARISQTEVDFEAIQDSYRQEDEIRLPGQL